MSSRTTRRPVVRTLVVVSPTLAPLSTEVPVPTDGQPTWWRCLRCDERTWVPSAPFGVAHVHHAGTEYETDEECLDDGPFPFIVAVWQEGVQCQECGLAAYERNAEGCEATVDWDDPEVDRGGRCHGEQRDVGVVVATVEVTGPSHRGIDCHLEWNVPEGERCRPNAAPNCWHTPVGQVARLARPIPMERPHVNLDTGRVPDDHPLWWADLDLGGK